MAYETRFKLRQAASSAPGGKQVVNQSQSDKRKNQDQASCGGNKSQRGNLKQNGGGEKKRIAETTIIPCDLDGENLWDNLDSFVMFKEYYNENRSSSFLPRLAHNVVCTVKMLAPMLTAKSAVNGPIQLSDEEIKEDKIEIARVTRGGVKKSFYYKILNPNGKVLTRNEMKRKLDSFMGTYQNDRYCYGYPECPLKDGQRECEVQGRSDFVLAHLQKVMGYPNVCYYCQKPICRLWMLKKHFIKHHWNRGLGEQFSSK